MPDVMEEFGEAGGSDDGPDGVVTDLVHFFFVEVWIGGVVQLVHTIVGRIICPSVDHVFGGRSVDAQDDAGGCEQFYGIE
jgi:hypothetical protein